MVESYLERELKFDVPAGFVLPELAGVGSEVSSTDTRVYQLRSEYYDTADHALRRASITLRRRTGDTDTGWQLKVPHAPAREELRVPLDGEPEGSEPEGGEPEGGEPKGGEPEGGEPDGGEPKGSGMVPAELDRLLLGARRGQLVRPVAVLRTERTVTRLLADDGRQLAEVADDSVRAAAAGPSATASSWREVEVELGAGDEALLQRVAELLCRHGAKPSASSSKLSRALSGSESAVPVGPLRAYLIEQQRALIAGDLALRRGDEAVIHKTRVATRRFRSTLRNFAELVKQPNRQRLDEELRWYAGLLGAVRDRQVQRARLLAMVDELDDTLVLGPVRARVAQELLREQAEHWAELQQVLQSRRYLDLLTAVDEFIQSLSGKSSTKRLGKLMRKAERKAANRLRLAAGDGDPELLHRARKAAKRARYAGELVQPLGGQRAAEQAARNESLQDLLGEHQDSLGSIELLKRLAAIAASTPGESGFSFGILYQRQLQRAAEVRQQAAELARERT
jgi:CHAD domain-containing protein